MSGFDFSGVELPEEIVVNKRVEPGFQKLTVLGIKDATAQSGAKGLNVEFESDKGGKFNQTWYLISKEGTRNDKVMSSFQYLLETFTGSTLKAQVTPESLSAILVGRNAEVTVGGRRSTVEREGKKYNNIYAELPFGGYKGERDPYIRGEWDTSSETSEDSMDNSGVNNDLPW